MSYSTGSANSMADLLSKIKTAATSAGWVTSSYAGDVWCAQDAAGTGFWTLRVLKEEDRVRTQGYGLLADACLFVYGSSGFSSTDTWGHPGIDRFNSAYDHGYEILNPKMAGPYARYHFFITGSYIHVVLEVATGAFAHLLIGTMDKAGAVYDGGQYTGASSWSYSPLDEPKDYGAGNGILSGADYPFSLSCGYVRAGGFDNTPAGAWSAFVSPDGSANKEGRALGLGRSGVVAWDMGGFYNLGSQPHPQSALLAVSANSLNNSTLLVPSSIYVYGALRRLRLLGTIKDYALCDMSFLSPGDALTYGSAQWKVFPAYRKGSMPDSTPGQPSIGGWASSVNLAYAYKVVV